MASAERHNRTSIRHQVLDGSVLVFLAEALFPITAIVTAAFLARQLGTAGYGLLSLAMLIVLCFMLTSGALFTASLIDKIRKRSDWLPVATRAIQFQLLVSVATMTLVWLLSGPIASAMGTPQLQGYLCLVAVGIPIHNLTLVYQRILVGRGRYRQRAAGGALRSIVRLVLIILLVELGLSIEGAILGIVGAWLVELAILSRMIRVPIFRRATFRVREMANYMAPLFLSSICMRVILHADLILLKGLGGTSDQAGLYAAAQNLALVPTLLIGAVMPLVLSSVAEMNKKHGPRAAQELCRDALRVTIIFGPFAALAAGAAPAIIGFIYGPGFAGSAQLLQILLLAAVGLLLVFLCTAILTVAGRPRLVLYLTAAMMAAVLAGHWIVIPRFGPAGAAWVTAGVACAGGGAGLVLIGRCWAVFPALLTVLRCAALAPAAFLVPTLWTVDGGWILIQLPALALAVALGLVLTGEVRTAELSGLYARCSSGRRRAKQANETA